MTEQPHIIHGAREIARYLGLSERAVFHKLEKRQIPGAFKLGTSWCLDVDLFRKKIAEQAA